MIHFYKRYNSRKMVWEDNNLVVEGQAESSDTDADSDDVPEDDFDLDQSKNDGSESEEDNESEDEDENGEGEDGGEKGDLKDAVEIGEGNDESETDDNDDDESIESNASDAESEDNDEHETDDEAEGNAGWADAMAKVLAMGKNSDKAVSVLSKAKKDNVIKKTVKSGDNVASDGEEEEEVEKKLVPLALRKARKREIDSIGRKMPDVLDRNAEKAFAKIATRGVVQLFNAVREQQKDIKSQLKEAGGSFRKQEKVFKNIDKNSFVELLTGKAISKPQGEPVAKKPKTEVKDENDENQSTWNILRDDFMLGAKMRDWDKESDGE